MSDDNTDPSVLSDGQLFHLVAMLLEVHGEMIFVHEADGKMLIAELRRRAGKTEPPWKQDLPPGGDA